MSLLYLEDYFEMVEQLPQEMVDNLTSIRELDLQVHNSMDMLQNKISTFFEHIIHMNGEDIEKDHNSILKEFEKNIEDSDEKIVIAQNMTDCVGKYFRHMEQDLLKFKVELEADNPGCTEIIDKRVDEQRRGKTKTSSNAYRLQNLLKRGTAGSRRHRTMAENVSQDRLSKISNIIEKVNDQNHMEMKPPQISLPASIPSTSSVVFSMDQMSPGGSAIVAAASQAIVATQQMQQGRRTASLKASFEAINSAGVPTASLSRTMSSDGVVSKELVAGAAQTAVAATQERRKKKRRRRRGNITSSSVENSADDSSPISAASSQAELAEEQATDPDPNEPRYCICNQIAFGDMVACDCDGCAVEWYHYSCVGVTVAPEGKWYCPQCILTMKKRSNKKHS